MATFSDRLRNLRIKRGYKQREVADKLGISESAYGYYEQGRREPSNDALRVLSEMFGVSIDYLLNGDTLASNEDPFTEEERELLERIKSDPGINLFFKDFASAPVEKQKSLIRIWKVLQEEENGKK